MGELITRANGIRSNNKYYHYHSMKFYNLNFIITILLR